LKAQGLVVIIAAMREYSLPLVHGFYSLYKPFEFACPFFRNKEKINFASFI
jgi:hypothetical protein